MPTNYRFLISWLLITFSLISIQTHAALAVADSEGRPIPTLSPLIKKVKPAVVNISVTATQQINNPLLNDPYFRHFFNIPENYSQKRQTQSAGSGVIIDAKKATVITNHHVVANADSISVSLSDGRSFEAELLGSDPGVDIAVLKLKNATKLTALPIADTDKLQVGDFVIAIGNPFGLGQTVTTGIISALERNGLGDEYENYIQTDAAINPGNSGGALVNLHGELVGINKAIIAPAGGNVGIGFAIPSDMAINSSEQILEYGEVRRGRIGVHIQNLTPELAEAFGLNKQQRGVLVTKTEAGSAAEKAGIKSEDIIIEIDGKIVSTAAELKNIVGSHRIDDSLKVTILRNKKQKSFKVKIKETSDSSIKALQQADNSSLLSGTEFRNTAKGVQIINLQPASKIAKAGLAPGDILLEINRKSISDISDLKQFNDDKQLLIRVLRGNAILFIAIR